MSSCLSGGGRAYGFEIEIIKSPSTSTITSQTSSPSSTLSESSNSPLAISTRKPRTPRKRPNQTYNEAAALLSTACPNIFPPKHLSKPLKKIIKPHHHESNFLLNDSCPSAVDLLLPFRVFDNTGFLLNQPVPEKPNSRMELLSRIGSFRENSSCQSPVKSDFQENSSELCNLEDFDAESILDEDIEEGIDSIMGGNNDYSLSESDFGSFRGEMSSSSSSSSCYGTFPMGLGLGLGFGGKFGFFSRALRHVGEGEWWRFPIVDVVNISPKLNNHHKSHTEKKKKNKVEKAGEEVKYRLETSPKQVKENPIPKQQKENEKEKEKENSIPKSNPGLLLKLNLDEVANAWSDRDWPFSDEISGQESDLHARLAQIDLFSENGGVREASVLRYKEKRRTRLFSKKIRYQVRKVNADRRPRMKGRFVRRPDSP